MKHIFHHRDHTWKIIGAAVFAGFVYLFWSVARATGEGLFRPHH